MSTVPKTLGITLCAVTLASVAHAGPSRACVDESERLVGQRAVLAGKDIPALHKVRDAAAEYPTRPGSSRALSMIWIGEALVDKTGSVREVWTVRPLRFDPAWPEFEAAIPTAIRKWSYEPAVVDGAPAPACVTVSVTINWK
jgi:hypothetical protein